MKKILFIILVMVLPSSLFAQYTFTPTTTGQITVNTVMVVSFTAGASASTTLSGVSILSSGTTISNAATVAIKSNLAWIVEINASSANFTPSGTGSTTMPCSILGFRKNGTSPFVTLSTAIQTLTTGNPGDASTTGNTFGVDINYNPGFNYTGDTYTMSIVYTITNQ